MKAMQSGRERFKVTPDVRREIEKIVDERVRETQVTREDFSELKGIVAELAQAQRELVEAQKRTEARLDGLTVKVEELAEAQRKTETRLDSLTVRMEELAEAQKRTEQRVEELAEAQKRTEQKVEELAEAQRRTEEEVRTLAVGLKRTREDLGGLSRSFSYAFENEAYRMLPKLLEEKYGIRLKEKMVRTDIGNQEVNFLARAEKEGREVYLVGEAKLRLDDGKKRKDVWKELEEKVKAVKEEYGEVEVVPFLVTHFATKGFLRQAKDRGIIVVQSFEW
ncbi:hypothetical protein QBE54_09710 [Thermatribacter velox]|uniref:Chordopoxvirus fusion protein n=1 Tax=Thermatribacter velox TaxID=3039681 RepID=A0ABZ2YA40_9BACT